MNIIKLLVMNKEIHQGVNEERLENDSQVKKKEK